MAETARGVQRNGPAQAHRRSLNRPPARQQCRILWIDDEIVPGDALLRLLEMEKVRTEVAQSGAEGMVKASAGQYDAIVLDLKLRDIFGLTVLERLQANGVSTPVLVATGAYLEPEMRTRALRAGAAAFEHKPFVEAAKLAHLLRSMIAQASRSLASTTLVQPGPDWPFGIVAASPAMQEVVQWIQRVGPTNASVLITGETGTGKELVARALHDVSSRAGAFIAVNCAAIAESLAESELFGYRRGAFTGAAKDSEGLFEAAHRGTLFLDELGELPMPMQARLLRCLDSGEIRKVGDTKARTVDIRVIAATNRPLNEAIAGRHFRADLYHRISVMHATVPPLRERTEDVDALVRYWLSAVVKRWRNGITDVSTGALHLLRTHPWPGNVRELRNVLERAVSVSSCNPLTEHDVAAALSDEVGSTPVRQADSQHPHDVRRVLVALEKHHWNRTRAARALGVNRTTLWRWLERYGFGADKNRE